MKLSQAIDGYLLDKKLEFSPRTVGNYSLFFRYFVEFTSDPEIESITTATIRRFLVSLIEQRNYSKRSTCDVWTALSSLFTWSQAELGIAHPIRGKIKMPTYPKAVIEPFTQDEIKRLIEAARYSTPWKANSGKRTKSRRPTAKRDIAVILTLLDSGIRNTELRELLIKDYDQDKGRLYIAKGKGNKRRFAVLGNRARKAIWRYMATRPDAKPDEPLFCTDTGNKIDKSNLGHLLKNIAALAGVNDVRPHRFRHSFAIQFLRNGGNIFVLQELLGHSSLTMVRHYARIAEIDLDAAVKHSVADNWKL